MWQELKIEHKRRLNARRQYLRSKGLDISSQQLYDHLVTIRAKRQDGDVLTSRDGSWTLATLCWKRREHIHPKVDGLLLYVSGRMWYSKKHRGSWSSREQAVEMLSGPLKTLSGPFKTKDYSYDQTPSDW